MLNKVFLIGNVGNPPEIRYTSAGSKVVNFNLATTEKWKDKSGEKTQITQWHKVVIFNENIATFVEQYVKKGTSLYVEGMIQYEKFTGTDGIERVATKVVVKQYKGDVKILSSKGSDSDSIDKTASFEAKEGHEVVNTSTLGDDEIPF